MIREGRHEARSGEGFLKPKKAGNPEEARGCRTYIFRLVYYNYNDSGPLWTQDCLRGGRGREAHVRGAC